MNPLHSFVVDDKLIAANTSQLQKPMNHTISISKIMKLNNFSNKTNKILSLSHNFGNHN